MAWHNSVHLELMLLQPEGGKVPAIWLKSSFWSFLDLDFPPSIGFPFLRRVLSGLQSKS